MHQKFFWGKSLDKSIVNVYNKYNNEVLASAGVATVPERRGPSSFRLNSEDGSPLVAVLPNTYER